MFVFLMVKRVTNSYNIVTFGQRWLINSNRANFEPNTEKSIPRLTQMFNCILSPQKPVAGQLRGQCIQHKDLFYGIIILG